MKPTISLIAAALLTGALPPPHTRAAIPPRPNVVLFLIDDLSHFTMPAYGAVKVATVSGKLPPTPIATPQMDRPGRQRIALRLRACVSHCARTPAWRS